MQSFDIIIVGNGMVGLAQTLALAESNLDIAVVAPEACEHWPERLQKSVGNITELSMRVSAISPANSHWLNKLGAWQLIPDHHYCPYRQMQVWDANSTGRVCFAASEIQQPYLGHIIENQILQAALVEKIKNYRNISFVTDRIVALKHKNKGVELQLESGTRLQSRLLIGADGANSKVRELCHITAQQTPYRQLALVAHLHCEKSHQHTAWQRFAEHGPLALLPLNHHHWVSMVWSLDEQQAQQLLQLSPDAQQKRIESAIEHKLGSLTLATAIASFPLIKRHAQRYIAPNLVLVGDAAHTIHPLAGLGANIGFADVQLLSQSLLDVLARGQDIARIELLRPFERARKSENRLVQEAMSGLKALFGRQYPPLVMARSIGLNLVNQNALLKQFFIQRAINTGA